MLLAAITLTQSTLTRHKSTFARTENLSFLPQGSRLAPYLCGFQTTFASYLWIKTTLYFGSEYMGEKKYAWLIHMIDAVTRLNPQFFPAYEFAGVMIPEVCHNPDVARIFLERGISHVVDKQKNSRLLFLAGWISFNYYNDHIRAAEYMERSAKIGNRRSFVTGFAATLYAKGGRKDMAIAYLASMLKDTEEPAARNMIISKLEGFGVKVE